MISKDTLKRWATKAVIQVAETTAMVAIDQAVRTIISEKIRPYFRKNKEQKQQQ